MGYFKEWVESIPYCFVGSVLFLPIGGFRLSLSMLIGTLSAVAVFQLLTWAKYG